MLRYNNFKSGGWKPITFVVREHSSKTHTYWIFFLAASSDIITYISVFKPIKQWKGKQKFRCLMDLLIICLGTRKIMLQCITCRVQTSTLNISGKPTTVIIWIFYNMKNASVKVRGGGGVGGWGEWHLREVWIWWVSRARQNLSISPPISDRMFLRPWII